MSLLCASVESVRPSWLRSDAIEPIVVRGFAYHRRQPVVGMDGLLGDVPVRAVAMDIERDDVFDRYRDTPRRSAYARRSGYVLAGLVGPLPASVADLQVEASLVTGDRVHAGDFELPVRAFER